MNLTCQHVDSNSDNREPDECGQPATGGIVTSEDCYDPQEPFAYERSHIFLVCGDHGPEEAHESATSLDPSEFAVVMFK